MSLVLALIIAGSPGSPFTGNPTGPLYSQASETGSLPFFAMATPSGAGMGAECACAAIAGAGGEVVTWARTSSAYCTKGNQNTGLTTASMVLCGSAQPRVTTLGLGTQLWIQQETQFAETAIRTEDFTDVAYVSTATVTADQATAPWGAVTADQLSDASDVAILSSCQAIPTSQSKFTVSVYLMAGTLAKASIRLTGTGDSAGDCVTSTTTLSSTLWTRINCTSPAAYGVGLAALNLCVEVGTVVGDTGTILADGLNAMPNCDHLTSYVAATSGSVTRQQDSSPVTKTLTTLASSGSGAISMISPFTSSSAAVGGLLFMNGAGRIAFFNTTLRAFDGTNEPTTTAGITANTSKRYWSSWGDGGLTITNATDTATTTSAFEGVMDTTGPLYVGWNPINIGLDYFLSQICVDTTQTRCR